MKTMTSTISTMTDVPEKILDPLLWKGFNVDTLYTLYTSGDLRAQDPRSAFTVYHPSSEVPTWVFCRVSESTKRLEKGLTTQTMASGSFGNVYSVVGSGSQIGVLFSVNQQVFKAAHCTPDGIHLVSHENLVDPIIKPVYVYKTFRAFRIGQTGDTSPHDLMITAKTRWFRKRNNPKSLGFSKDNK